MKQLVIIIALISYCNCYGQLQYDKTKISIEIQEVVTRIENLNELMGRAVGYAGIRPEQFNNFIDLQKTAAWDELIELTNYPNAVVRCYAIWALSYDSTLNLFPLVLKHLSDTARVKTLFGCIGSREQVGDFFINVVTPGYVDLRSNKLNNTELKILDSILVYTPNTLYAKQKAIGRIEPTENVYFRARDLVINENNQEALVTLAKFKKQQDIPLILKNKTGNKQDNGFFSTYKAICEFPDPAFLPLLSRNLNETLDDTHYDNEWTALYKAIASYKNDTALQLLKIPFTQLKHQDIREYHMAYVFNAVQSFYTPLYDELLWKLWENEKLINQEVFEILYHKNAEKAFELTKKTIENADDFYYLSTNDYYDSDQDNINLIDIMLDTIINYDKTLAIKLINKNIKDINVHAFPTFADKVLQLKDTSMITSLFKRLETEDNPHIYLKASKVLIHFNDDNINKRLVEVSKRNESMHEDWGGKEFARLLRENNIK